MLARILVLAILSTDLGAALAQDAGGLVSGNAANRSGAPEVSRLIAELIAERSASAAVRERAARAPQWGRLELGVDEILAEIGATDALSMSPSAFPVTAPVPVAVSPSVAAPTAAAPAVVTAAEPPPVSTPAKRASPSFDRLDRILGREDRGGGGGRSGSGGGGAGGW